MAALRIDAYDIRSRGHLSLSFLRSENAVPRCLHIYSAAASPLTTHESPALVPSTDLEQSRVIPLMVNVVSGPSPEGTLYSSSDITLSSGYPVTESSHYNQRSATACNPPSLEDLKSISSTYQSLYLLSTFFGRGKHHSELVDGAMVLWSEMSLEARLGGGRETLEMAAILGWTLPESHWSTRATQDCVG